MAYRRNRCRRDALLLEIRCKVVFLLNIFICSLLSVKDVLFFAKSVELLKICGVCSFKLLPMMGQGGVFYWGALWAGSIRHCRVLSDCEIEFDP